MVFSLVLFGVVMGLSSVSATIVVHPSTMPVSTEFSVDISSAPTGNGQVTGRVISQEHARTEQIVLRGDASEGIPVPIVGGVTLHNTSGTAQPLVATTRLLTPEGVLYRLEDRVTVPAGGTIVAAVYADEPGPEQIMQEGARLTIPGLRANRQEQVFAISNKTTGGGLKFERALVQSDIDEAIEHVAQELEAQAMESVRAQTGAGHVPQVWDTQVLDVQVGASVGDIVSEFELTLQVRVSGVAYDDEVLMDLATEQLFASVPEGYALHDADTESFYVDIEHIIDGIDARARARVSLSGVGIPSRTHPLLSTERFSGLSAQEVQEMLVRESVADAVDVNLSPFWVQTVPQAHHRVRIDVQ